AAAQRARTAEKYVVVFSFYAPTTDLAFPLGKWKGRRVVKDVAMVHSQRVLNIHRALAFDARSAIARQGETTFDRFLQPLIAAWQIFLLRFPPHLSIVSCEQAPRRVESEKCHRLKALLT